MDPSPNTELPIGTLVGAYRLERVIGAGGAGTVYEAVEPTIDKRVAIKILRLGYAGDTELLERFRREAQAANVVRHPGIVDVFAIGSLPDGRPYLVMSLLEGRPLSAEIAACGRLDPGRAWSIARDVAEALLAAHEAGIVHRDLKPDNVFLEALRDRPVRPRILDFGLAKILSTSKSTQGAAKLTQAGAMVGTPAYMAPEQWFNAGVDSATDQYALGAMLYEMLAGGPPFNAERLDALLKEHLHDAPPPLADKGVSVPSEVEALVARALAKAPSDRFESVAAFIRAGDAAFAGLGVSCPPASSPTPAAEPPLDKTVPSSSSTRPPVVSPAKSEPSAVGSVPGKGSLAAGAFRRFLLAHGSLLFLSLAGLVAIGYTGPGRHDVLYWARIAGHMVFLVGGLFLVGSAMLVVLARRRFRTGASSLGLGWCLLPGILGGVGTCMGWLMVLKHTREMSSTIRFATASAGMYEANAGQFIGFGLSAILFLSASVLAGMPGSGERARSLSRVSLAASLGLAVLAVAGLLGGAPSGALVAGAGALVLAASLSRPPAGPGDAGQELAKCLASLLALGFTIDAGFARVEAREGFLWTPEANLTRAARAREIVAAAAERQAFWIFTAASLALLLLVVSLRLRRFMGERAFAFSWRRGAWLFAAVAVGAADVALHAWMRGEREEYRLALDAQFARLGRHDPPVREDLGGELFAPTEAPALQITSEVVAVNGDALAKLKSTELEALLARRLNEVASRAAASADLDSGDRQARPELLVSVDREVEYATLVRGLRVARRAGVSRIALLLARSPAPVLTARSPPEASYPIPGDFAAVPFVLADSGFTADAKEPFRVTAQSLVGLSLGRRESQRVVPVPIAVALGE